MSPARLPGGIGIAGNCCVNFRLMVVVIGQRRIDLREFQPLELLNDLLDAPSIALKHDNILHTEARPRDVRRSVTFLRRNYNVLNRGDYHSSTSTDMLDPVVDIGFQSCRPAFDCLMQKDQQFNQRANARLSLRSWLNEDYTRMTPALPV